MSLASNINFSRHFPNSWPLLPEAVAPLAAPCYPLPHIAAPCLPLPPLAAHFRHLPPLATHCHPLPPLASPCPAIPKHHNINNRFNNFVKKKRIDTLVYLRPLKIVYVASGYEPLASWIFTPTFRNNFSAFRAPLKIGIFFPRFYMTEGSIFKIPSCGSLFFLLQRFHDMKTMKEVSGL